MKRLIIIVLLLLAFCYPVSALHLNFQNYGDLADIGTLGGADIITWVESPIGGNNYISLGAGGGAHVVNKNPMPMTYASAVSLQNNGNGYDIHLYDSSGTTIYIFNSGGLGLNEVIITGGTAKLYLNGVAIATSTPLAVNPSYIGWAQGGFTSSKWDNMIWGDSEPKYILGMPETNLGGTSYYILKKSIIDPANSGLANGATYVVVSSNNMTTTWSKNNPDPEIMYFKQSGTGQIVWYENVSGYTGSVVWPLQEAVFNKITSYAPYGSYIAYLSGSPSTVSTPIQYISSGATIAFSQDLYSTNDNALYSWNIQTDYWNLRSAGYSFSTKIIDVYGQTKTSTAVTSPTGSYSYTFVESDPDGVYYVALIATDPSGNEIWVAYDYATLTGYLTFIGYANDAQTAKNLSVVNFSITQGTTVYNFLSQYGNYSTAGTALGAGQLVTFNITAPGHQQYRASYIPLATKTAPLNFTLNATTMTASGVSGMGIVRDDVYGRPIPNVVVTYTNVSHSTVHSATTNNAGYYLIDALHGGPLVSGYCYLVNSSLSRYTQVAPSAMKCVV